MSNSAARIVDIGGSLEFVDAIANALLAAGESSMAAHDLESTLFFAFTAASVLSTQNRTLTSRRAEELVLRVASHPELEEKNSDLVRTPTGARGCLHVVTEALGAGGLTAMVSRWISNDTSGRVHRVVLLSQGVEVPNELQEVVGRTGGQILTAGAGWSHVAKAIWLRRVAKDLAEHVVLHVDVSDVVCGAAFGVPGGPPVMLVNHSAHVFWMGGSVADVVLNCRGSAMEAEWTKVYRGNPRHLPLPIPLPAEMAECGSRDEARQEFRAKNQIPIDGVVLMTAGSSFKYLPCNGLDFLGACDAILREVPNAYIVAAGVQADARWKSAADRTNGRLLALGAVPRDQIEAIRSGADIYLEGFPFGTTTALLEAGASGLPVVLAPEDCPPPYGSDGIALDNVVVRPPSTDAYVEHAVSLCRSSAGREAEGMRVQASILKHHTGDGWRGYLQAAIDSLPACHAPAVVAQTPTTPKHVHEYWARFVQECGSGYDCLLENRLMSVVMTGRSMRLGRKLALACIRSDNSRRTALPVSVLRFYCNVLLPSLPRPVGAYVLRLSVVVAQGRLLFRLLRKLIGVGATNTGNAAWYEDLRRVRG